MTALIASLAITIAAPVPPDKGRDAELEKKVAPARAKAIKYLKDSQQPNGSWEGEVLKSLADIDGGATALAVLGLLEAGVPAKDPAVAKAVEYLLALKPSRTYVVSLRTQALARVDATKYAQELQAGADWLLGKAITRRGKLVGWSYPGGEIADNSNTHFAVMALHAAAQSGAKVDADIWLKVRDLYTDTQHKGGGWMYCTTGGDAPSHSMTLVALLSLAVAVKYDEKAAGPGPAFEKGMAAFLGEKVGKFGDGQSSACFWMTAAELGHTLGSTEFKSGQHARAWYREGAEKILKEQQADGSWKPGAAVIDKNYPVVTTACGLYLLGRPLK
ncbi:prenyltransferase squalene oxidase : Uncharacterized protein OS=Blastopirellula marina DSM 3645 GN=DSM3645_14280 PE=4 SV=1: Prenyltrans_1 [Gemmata massiliana]|uniref:Squalene cyclase C-terminal domain-containing protein n=1 Tax=Gemmata massiliana TaxID=1210884 RepID=A0A6P2DB01_9BACT|nr:prenyltransferase/squalene oxidase repeat-containing protein [Gemmata massiliana]VTR97414.1 prenyltransferase squalene oxidase : Uncharacterized protein OS=Blastopirellula marina DSM 3645 GN=DSM3645_14280 PE=4 SV=1: Prenyltrans_1 [Gemmata massiliana]